MKVQYDIYGISQYVDHNKQSTKPNDNLTDREFQLGKQFHVEFAKLCLFLRVIDDDQISQKFIRASLAF